jgi:hypothetical protein
MGVQNFVFVIPKRLEGKKHDKGQHFCFSLKQSILVLIFATGRSKVFSGEIYVLNHDSEVKRKIYIFL